jgi:hypothetical protein
MPVQLVSESEFEMTDATKRRHRERLSVARHRQSS